MFPISFPWLWVASSHVHAHQTQSECEGLFSFRSLEIFFCATPCLYSDSLILSAFTSLSYKLCLLNSGRPLVLFGSLFFLLLLLFQSLETLREVHGGNYRAHFLCFIALRNLRPVVSVVRCLNVTVSHSPHPSMIFFIVCGRKINLVYIAAS